ncbi:MAG: nucleotidyltransferase family protein [Gemmatimonadota bacterium]|nr:nucleotidyltransferase family protein [Gemmatimonadota bacterium]
MTPASEKPATATTKAVIMARGLGSRMRAAANAGLTADQASAADAGVKGMIPIGRPFLDFVISALADAGITDVCLVIGPEHTRMREYYEREVALTRVRVHFAVQDKPLGTADAVVAAESFAGGEHVLVLNSDNYYPIHTLRALRVLGGAGVAAFERDALLALSNIGADRIAKFSVVRIDANGMLKEIIEKPDENVIASLGRDVFVGMNSWSLPPEIYDACRRVAPSVRGELELQDAVNYARDEMGIQFKVLQFHDGVLDLSSRGDIASVAEALRDTEPRL